MEDAFFAAQEVGHGAENGGRPAHHDHLGAEVVIEMDMGCREHLLMVIVLNVGEARGEVALVMVVEEGERAENFTDRKFDLSWALGTARGQGVSALPCWIKKKPAPVDSGAGFLVTWF